MSERRVSIIRPTASPAKLAGIAASVRDASSFEAVKNQDTVTLRDQLAGHSAGPRPEQIIHAAATMQQDDKGDRTFGSLRLDDFAIQQAVQCRLAVFFDGPVHEVLGPAINVTRTSGIPRLRVTSGVPFDLDHFS